MSIDQIEELAWVLCDIPKHPSIKSCEQCGNKHCHACSSFQRIRPRYCGRCGATFYERQPNRICGRCRIAKKSRDIENTCI